MSTLEIRKSFAILKVKVYVSSLPAAKETQRTKAGSLNNYKPFDCIYGRYVACISHLSFEAGIKIIWSNCTEQETQGWWWLLNRHISCQGRLMSAGQNKFCQPKEVKASCDWINFKCHYLRSMMNHKLSCRTVSNPKCLDVISF